MAIVYFITHPEVVIDPAVPVTDWSLSAVGIERARTMLKRPWVGAVGSVFCSAERKAGQVARMMADQLSLSPIVIEGLGENDRSATGYLPKPEFEAVADEFFARPEESVRGWERAIDAQHRIVAAVNHALSIAPDGDVAVVSHGGVGALLLCYLKRAPISRSEDQPGQGGGNVFSFAAATRRLLSGWRRIEG
jgi:broad specificity phosphatase PhoE